MQDDCTQEGDLIARNRSIVEEARSAARALVDREARNGGRMVAYFRVASMVGTSEVWIRRFISGSPDASPNLVVGFNILQQYQRIASKRE